ncbi:MAG: restriction endonuclease subunit S [Draconibacterium sp.]
MTAQELKNSILQYAIQGKLVPQDPNDEPASVLLQKIEAEKQQLVKKKRIKKGKPLSPILEDEIPFEIPESWEWVRLRDIVSLLGDGIHGTPTYDNEGDYFFVNGNNLENGKIVIKPSTKRVNFEEHLKHKRALNHRSILVSINGTLGNIAFYNGEKIILGKSACYFNLCEPLSLKYIKIIINGSHFEKYAIANATQTTIQNVSLKSMRELLIPLPPLAEQHRIVEKIEELMPLVEAYDKAEKELTELNTRFPDQIKKSILQHAIQGKLIPQNPTDEPASVLLERIKTEKQQLVKEKKIKAEKPLVPITEEEIPFEIPESWKWVRLGEVCKFIHYGYTASAEPNGNARLLRITDIQNSNVIWGNVPYCTVSEKEFASYGLNNRDILIARTGGTIGKTYIVRNLNQKAVFASYLIRAVPSDFINEVFLKTYLESPHYWSQLLEKSNGTGQPNVNGQSLMNLIIALPPLAEQHRIVEKVEEVLAVCNKLK